MNRRTLSRGVAQKFWLVTLTTLVPIIAAPAQKTAAGFGPTIPNTGPTPQKVPIGMVWIPGGEFSMGAQDPPGLNDVGIKATLDSRPVHRVYVDGFFMDKTDVTNAQFEKFVRATGYVTVAERKPRAEDYPNATGESGCGLSRLCTA